MASQEVVLRLSGLTKAEQVELAEHVDPAYVTVEREPVPEGAHGELVLLTVGVIATAAALKGLVAYLALRHRGKSFDEEIEAELPDGTKIRRRLRWKDTSGEPLEKAIVQELSTIPGLESAMAAVRAG